MAVEFGTLPRQTGLDEFLGDLLEIGNRPGAWAKVSGPAIGDAVSFARRWKMQDLLAIDPDDFEMVAINGELWVRAKVL